MSRPKLSAALIAKNEAKNLKRCLPVLKELCDEIVLVDSGSTDDTVAVARSFGAKVLETDWPGYAKQKQRALELATGDWIFSIDADEVPDEELKEALRGLPSPDQAAYAGYRVDRLTEYLGEWVDHAWSPDWLLRVVERGKGRFTERAVHELLEVDGPVGPLPGRLLHYSYDALSDHYTKLLRYAELSAEELEKRGRSFRLWQLLVHPSVAFVRLYIGKRGILDGVRGLLVAGAVTAGTFFKYAFLFERQWRRNRSDRP